MRPLVLSVVMGLVVLVSAGARTWTDSTGKHKTEAEFVDCTDGVVRLKKDDGAVISVPMEKLSEADQEFVRLSADGAGVPARITRVEDVGRHKIVRLDVAGCEVSAIADEATNISADVTHIAFETKGINVYADGWRVPAAGEPTP